MPVISYYESKGKVRKINANRPIDAVFADVKPLFISSL
jgi:UMP-CMP kinase